MLAQTAFLSRPKKWPLINFARSVASAAATAPVSGSISHNLEEVERKTAGNVQAKGEARASAASSQNFLKSLSQTHFASLHRPQPTEAELVKREVSSLLQNGSYDVLLRALLKWTGGRVDATWQSVLSHDELSFIIGKIVNFQIGLITKAGTAHQLNKKGMHALSTMTHARDVREKIRSIYRNLLYGPSHGHLYSRKGRENFRSSFQLKPQDFENLISMELNNGKLDLASKWFQRMELQYGDNSHYRHMTQKLWLLKFQVYGGGEPSLWKVAPTDLYEMEVNPRQSRLKSERKWLDIFNEYVNHQHLLLASTKVIFDTKLLGVMFASMAYSNNVGQITKLIEQNWGISPRGKMTSGFAAPKVGDPLYPDLELLKTIVTSMIFNKEYVASMAYLNAFQEHYGINLTDSKHFWDQLFRWSEITTRFSEFRALQYFIKETATTLYKPTSQGEVDVLLREAQQSADFDYEGYLKFVGDLTNQRSKLIGELWKCYHESKPGFSVRVYQTYLRLLEENPLDDLAYEILSSLALENHQHKVSSDSFNRSATTDRVAKIRALYSKGMRILLNEKGTNGKLGQLEPLISKWALDDAMAERLRTWVGSQQPRFLEISNKKSINSIAQHEEEEEGFLGLMS